jgi:hypothetical protein
VIQAHCDVNQGLQEEAARPAFGGPDFLEHFVAHEELPGVEELDAVEHPRVH